MRILQIANYMYPSLGGIEQMCRNAAAVFRAEGIEQKIICFNENTADGDWICKRHETVTELVDGTEVIRCGCIGKLMSQSISLSFPGKLRQVLHEFQPDVVVFHYPNPFEAAFLRRTLGKETKLVLYWHFDITRQKLVRRLFRGQTRWLLKRACRIIVTSANYMEGSRLLQSVREKCRVVPNCIDPERLTVTEECRGKQEEIRAASQGKKIIFALGRHVKYKGFRYLIEAEKELDPDCVIRIGGDGVLSRRLKHQAGKNPRIRFLGQLSQEDLIANYMACDVFAFPSITKNEGFGIALAEAMYFGKPAVTFSIPGSGVNEVCENGVTGVECPNRDVHAYAGAINRLLSDPALRKQYGVAARRRVMTHYTDHVYQQALTEVLNEIKTEQ